MSNKCIFQVISNLMCGMLSITPGHNSYSSFSVYKRMRDLLTVTTAKRLHLDKNRYLFGKYTHAN